MRNAHVNNVFGRSSQTLAQINHLVGRINGQFGTFDYTPVHFIHQTTTSSTTSLGGNLVGLDTAELCAVYRMAQVCIVSSIRDGMNLVGHEFCVCQDTPEEGDGPGVLVLSEFTGSATSLNGALLINPWNPDEGCQALHQALTMTKVERTLRMSKLIRVISSHTAIDWATTFLGTLAERRHQNQRLASTSRAPRLCPHETLLAYRETRNRVIIADLDGMFTLPLHHQATAHGLATTSAFLKSTLERLSQDQHNTVFLVSGRERKFLEVWLGGAGSLGLGSKSPCSSQGKACEPPKASQIGLAAEDGLFYRLSSTEDWKTMTPNLYGTNTGNPTDPEMKPRPSWKDKVIKTMQRFTERTPGSVIESKEGSLTWHYHDADVHFGNWQAKDLQSTLERELMGTPLDVIQGNRLLMVQHEGFSKATIVEGLLKYLSLPEQMAVRGEVDFIFCVGDEASDEQMFQSLHHLVDAAMEHSSSVVSPVPSSTEASPRTLDGLEYEPIRIHRNTALYTVHVGNSEYHPLTSAKYSLTSLGQFRRILKGFTEISKSN